MRFLSEGSASESWILCKCICALHCSVSADGQVAQVNLLESPGYSNTLSELMGSIKVSSKSLGLAGLSPKYSLQTPVS